MEAFVWSECGQGNVIGKAGSKEREKNHVGAGRGRNLGAAPCALEGWTGILPSTAAKAVGPCHTEDARFLKSFRLFQSSLAFLFSIRQRGAPMLCTERMVLFEEFQDAVVRHGGLAKRLFDLAAIIDRDMCTEMLVGSRIALELVAEARQRYEEHISEHGCEGAKSPS